MAKFMTDAVADAMLNSVAASTRMSVCSAQPATFADLSTVTLASVTMAVGDFTIANGDASGRKVTVALKANLNINVTGTADHVVLDDGTNLKYGTTATAQALTSGGTVTVPSWKIEIADPT